MKVLWQNVIPFFVFSLAIFIMTLKMNMVMIGYEIGQLKHKETELLKTKSILTAQLAKLTTKDQLLRLIAEPKEGSSTHVAKIP